MVRQGRYRPRWYAALLSACALPCGPSAQAQDSYSLPVQLPREGVSPPVAKDAPYTPTVRRLIAQILPDAKPTLKQLQDASMLLGGAAQGSPLCHGAGYMRADLATQPRLSPLCFTDGLGINVINGPNKERTTGMPSMLALASSFDLHLANAMGQMEGAEGRALMTTGLLGPQADTNVFVNWARGLHTPGEDPWLNGKITAAQVHGIQSRGMMAQVKHFAGYNGPADGTLLTVQDQALHEIYLLPYEMVLRESAPSSIMCSYSVFQDRSPYLPTRSRAGRATGLSGAHFACQHPLTLSYVLRDLWGFKGFVGSDYGGVHSTASILAGMDREDPGADYMGPDNPKANGLQGAGCPTGGCGLAEAVYRGLVPLSRFKQSLARVLYQEERFGLLGCDEKVAACRNAGGVNGDRSADAPLPDGPSRGIPVAGTRHGDAAIIEAVAERGAVLLKNDRAALPLVAGDLAGGIAVSGGGAEYLIANPTNEGATGFAERNAINPLQQLRALSGQPNAFSYTPANGATGMTIACDKLRPASAEAGSCGLTREEGAAMESLAVAAITPSLDHTAASAAGQLAGGKVYRWSGMVLVDKPDDYVFRIQHSTVLGADRVKLSLDGADNTLSDAASFYYGQYYGTQPVDVHLTHAGLTEAGLANRQCDTASATTHKGMFADAPPGGPVAPDEAKGKPARTVVACADRPATGWHRLTVTLDATGITGPVSLRLAVSRRHGDIEEAARAAAGKAKAIVFLNDHDRNTINPFPNPKGYDISSLAEDQIELVRAVAAVNPATIVVLNTGTPVVVKEWIDHPHVSALLNMWMTGQEGGTATARLLLGQANPAGHLTVTWPRTGSDTISHYDQPQALYDGDTAGPHPERINGLADHASSYTQGIFSGYRYYDKLGIPVQFPFGYGLSYSRFAFWGLSVKPLSGGRFAVHFRVTNTSDREGTQVAQVYVGAGPARRGVQQALRSLRGFARVTLRGHETRPVRILLDARSFQYWDEKAQAWRTNTGARPIFVGDANATAHLPLRAAIRIRNTRGQRP